MAQLNYLRQILYIWALLAFLMISPVSCDDNTNSDNNPLPKKVNTPTSAFLASISTIIVSELGDKTFFIAAIMAMRYNRLAVLGGALLALFLMTAISTVFGSLVTTLIPAFYTHVLVTGLFFFFGFKLFYDAYKDEGKENNEKSEVEMELNELHSKMLEKKSKTSNTQYADNYDKSETDKLTRNIDIEATAGTCTLHMEQIATKLVFGQALTLTFLGEWGDRSQISTIALAADNNAFIVFVGAFLGHCLCTGLAVQGGKYLANKISEKVVNICGGALFLIFGFHNIIVGSPQLKKIIQI